MGRKSKKEGIYVYSLPLGLALGSPIFPSGCEGKLGVALEQEGGERQQEACPGSSPDPYVGKTGCTKEFRHSFG